MKNFILVVSICLISFGIMMFIADYLPVELSSESDQIMYLKHISSSSFHWKDYRMHSLVSGITILLFARQTQIFRN